MYPPDDTSVDVEDCRSTASDIDVTTALQDISDDDSTLGSDVESSTASITSSILAYRTINGRRYYSDAVTESEYWYVVLRTNLR